MIKKQHSKQQANVTMTNNDDEQRYAEYFKQQDPTTPLDEVRNLRAEQLAACDLKKHQEMAQMRKQLEDEKDKP